VKDAVTELAHVYAELKQMGAGLQYIDIGGGLGVDYDGSRTNYESSMNYTLAEYASDVVYRIGSVCNARGIEHPVIVSESGRAICAHHSVLVCDVLASSRLDVFRVSEADEQQVRNTGDMPQPVRDLLDAYRSIAERRLVECYHDALQAREQALQMFSVGYLSLEQRGLVERLYWATCAKIRDLCRRLPTVPEELEDLETILSDIYFCNLSVFQSLPDSWAIDQLFPIMPIHRLDERPNRTAVLADITCDSDGKIDHFVSLRDVKRTLELHPLREGEVYHLAAFQDTFNTRGWSLDRAAYFSRYLGFDDLGLLREFGEENGLQFQADDFEALLLDKSRRYEDRIATGEVLYTTAKPAVARLGAAFKLAIASGSLRSEIVSILTLNQLTRAFPVVVGADDVRRRRAARARSSRARPPRRRSRDRARRGRRSRRPRSARRDRAALQPGRAACG
jgi:phosphoglycolate phosphatase-like HAD superfamily hydrolase